MLEGPTFIEVGTKSVALGSNGIQARCLLGRVGDFFERDIRRLEILEAFLELCNLAIRLLGAFIGIIALSRQLFDMSVECRLAVELIAQLLLEAHNRLECGIELLL